MSDEGELYQHWPGGVKQCQYFHISLIKILTNLPSVGNFYNSNERYNEFYSHNHELTYAKNTKCVCFHLTDPVLTSPLVPLVFLLFENINFLSNERRQGRLKV